MKKQRELDLDAYPFTVRKLTTENGGGYLVEYPDVPLCQNRIRRRTPIGIRQLRRTWSGPGHQN